MNIIRNIITQKVDKDIADIIEHYLWKEKFNNCIQQFSNLRHSYRKNMSYNPHRTEHRIIVSKKIVFLYLSYNNKCYLSYSFHNGKEHCCYAPDTWCWYYAPDQPIGSWY